MDIDLHERGVTNAAEAMDLAGLDDQNVTGAGFEFRTVDDPHTPTFPHELDFVVGMPMGPRPAAREGAEEEHGHVHVAVIGPDELVRAAHEGQVVLADAVHRDAPDGGRWQA
jgi:hypothetical protein